LALANSIGLIDNGYRGELLVRFKATARGVTQESLTHAHNNPYICLKYNKGDRIAQLVIRKTELMEIEEVEELTETERGLGGFGSSGN
jgi:dUTP pyrophosphatase